MDPMVVALIIFGWVGLVIVAIVVISRVRQSDRARARLFYKPPTTQQLVHIIAPSDEPKGLARWLFLAGYRNTNAAQTFIYTEVALAIGGLGIVGLIHILGVIDNLMLMIGAQHGGSLDIIAPLFYLAPWTACFIAIMLPVSVVRTKRAKLASEVDQDLPLTLEILSTLVESGLSFDPALARLLESSRPERPLTRELQNFRDETRAGRGRVESFRRLAKRVDVMSLSTFVSAIVQAEQAGGGVGQVLADQSVDLRKRRRERALEAATALPVKQLIPLFICFLPGIFVWSLGPTMYQLLQFFNGFGGGGNPMAGPIGH